MTDEPALLAAILADPADDTVRLAYADWLDEHARALAEAARLPVTFAEAARLGRSVAQHCRLVDEEMRSCERGWMERAEFVRVQVELARLPNCGHEFPSDQCSECSRNPPSPEMRIRAAALRARERELLRGGSLPGEIGRNWQAWFGDSLPDLWESFHQSHYHIERGFVSHVTCTYEDWAEHAEAIYWRPEQTVRCAKKSCRLGRIMTNAFGFRRCRACSGKGVLPRPFPPTAQPITHLTLTTIPEWDDESHPDGLLGLLKANWPGLTIALPPEVIIPDATGNGHDLVGRRT